MILSIRVSCMVLYNTVQYRRNGTAEEKFFILTRPRDFGNQTMETIEHILGLQKLAQGQPEQLWHMAMCCLYCRVGGSF